MNDETINKIMALVEEVETASYGLCIERSTDNAWARQDYETRIDKATDEIEALLRGESNPVENDMGWPAVTVDQLKAGDVFQDPDSERTYEVRYISESLVTPGFFNVRVSRPGFDKAMTFGYRGHNTVYREES